MNYLFKTIALLVVLVFLSCGQTHRKTAYVPQEKLDKTQKPLSLNKRIIHLEGAHNFRDIGGLITKEGKMVKRGLLFRSDNLAELSNEDVQKLETIPLTKIIDLRSGLEIALEADRIPNTAQHYHFQMGKEVVAPKAFNQKFLSGYWDGNSFSQFMIAGNKQMVKEGDASLPLIFDQIVENHKGATVFHCAGGKDRTGLVAAFLLSLLEVPREQIIQDYLATNSQRKEYNEAKEKKLRAYTNNTLDEGLFEAKKAQRAYIEAALNMIDQEYGGIEKYARFYLKISDDKIKAFRQKMLQ